MHFNTNSRWVIIKLVFMHFYKLCKPYFWTKYISSFIIIMSSESDNSIEILKSLFKGIEDVFAVRWENGNKNGYMPAVMYDPYFHRTHRVKQNSEDKTYAYMDEAERQSISDRTKAALDKKRAAGQKLGRPFGTTSNVLKEHRKEVLEYAQKGLSFTAIGKIFGVTRQTVSTFLKTAK